MGGPIQYVYSKGVSVLMPGDDIASFIAYPTPAPQDSSSRTSSPNSIQEC
ncbi:unnamed protein product [Arabidopsis thaliana]|uniref:Uncharacterized protein n=1 Tax=Arabidopsis thaliana TaxID=3702 RepID=A0A5S9WN87_ARATH|nr:unnamed protein product [Arabidopsis thaliana]